MKGLCVCVCECVNVWECVCRCVDVCAVHELMVLWGVCWVWHVVRCVVCVVCCVVCGVWCDLCGRVDV